MYRKDSLELHPYDAQNYNIVDGEVVSIPSRRGSLRVKTKVTEKTKPNVVFPVALRGCSQQVNQRCP